MPVDNTSLYPSTTLFFFLLLLLLLLLSTNKMARDHKFSFVIPRRKSSIQALPQEPTAVEDSRPSHINSSSKAHKILGSSDANVRHHGSAMPKPSKKLSSARTSLMRIPESRPYPAVEERPQKDGSSSSHHPPQTATSLRSDIVSNDNNETPLRQRASSPLLGNSYRSRQGSLSSLPPPPKPPAQLPHRSASKLQSFFDVQDPHKAASRSQGDLTLRKATARTTKRAEHHTLSDVPELAVNNVKDKRRPPRIDLSKLFPKPHAPAVPLLSPNRMTHSPSPVSTNSDASPTKAYDPPGNTFFKSTRPRDSVRMMREKQNEYNGSQRTGRPREWFDGPEGDVSDDEVPFTEKFPTPPLPPPPSGYSQTRNRGDGSKHNSPARTHKSSTADCESIGIPSISKGSKTSDPMATPTPGSSITLKVQNSLQSWELGSTNSSRSRVSSVSKKIGNSAFQNSNLNESSVLCLTSSDEEDEEEELGPFQKRESFGARSDVTDAEAAFGACTLGGLPGVASSKSRNSVASDVRPAERTLPRARNAPPPLSIRPRASSGRPRPSSNIPMISEPPEDDLPPLPSNPTLDARSPDYLGRNRAPASNRRSRVIAVTRHEESLLEIMRQRASGQQQSNMVSDGKENACEDRRKAQPERSQRSHRSNQSSVSSPFTDTSFLRLSTCSPSQTGTSTNVVPDPGTLFMDSDGSASYGASDTDQRTDYSNASPRFSLIHSDTIPSPSTTSVASPLTPTLPMHKFSPQPPAAEPSPSSQQSANVESRRHSRTRTDSSTAIVFDGSDDRSPKRRGRLGSAELPVWAVGWRDDSAGLGVVH